MSSRTDSWVGMIEKRSTLGFSQACASATAGESSRAPAASAVPAARDQKDVARCGRESEVSFINVSVRGWLDDCAFAM